MNSSDQNPFAGSSGSGEFESTLRLLASLTAPEGLEERIEVGLRAGLRAASRTDAGKARILAWLVALRMQNAWLRSSLARSAAAAAIVLVVAGGSWGVYSHVQPIQPAKLVLPLRAAPQGGFSSAGAMRTPQTLNGPVIAPPVPTVTEKTKASPRTSRQTPHHRSKPAAAQKATAQSATPAAK
jgi:hypothetical protein